MPLVFPPVALEPTRSLAGEFMESRGQVKRRPGSVLYQWADSFQQELYGGDGHYLRHLMDEAPLARTRGEMRNAVLFSLEPLHVNRLLIGSYPFGINGGFVPLDPPVPYTDGPRYYLTKYEHGITGPLHLQFTMSGRDYRVHGQCNTRYPAPHILWRVYGPAGNHLFGVPYPSEGESMESPTIEWTLIAPPGQTPNVWLESAFTDVNQLGDIGRLQLVRYTYAYDIYLGTYPGPRAYSPTTLMGDDWGWDTTQGFGAVRIDLRGSATPYTSGTGNTHKIDFWGLKFWTHEVVPQRSWLVRVRTDTPGVCVLGSVASCEILADDFRRQAIRPFEGNTTLPQFSVVSFRNPNTP